jgi:hypothetical protein
MNPGLSDYETRLVKIGDDLRSSISRDKRVCSSDLDLQQDWLGPVTHNCKVTQGERSEWDGEMTEK